MTKPKISLIIVNWNGYHHLSTCLNSILNQTLIPDEIIFVDNQSSDDSVAFVQKNFPTIKVVQLKNNRGFSGGNNAGLEYARGDLIALINNDIEADPLWLEESTKALQANPAAGLIACRICLFYSRNYIDTAGDFYFRSGYPSKRGWLQKYGNEYSYSTWVFGACAGAAVYRKGMIDKIGFFDEDYTNYQEDVDLSFRAQLAGYRCLYVPTAIVYHKVSSSMGIKSTKRQYWSHRNHWFTLIKNLPLPLWVRYSWDIFIAEIFVLGSSFKQKRFGVFFRSRVDVMRYLPTMLRKRKKIQSQRKVNCEYLDSIIQSNWIQFRKAEKQREQRSSHLLYNQDN